MNASYGVCNLTVIPLRAEPSDKAEIKTQLLFGDAFKILERQEKWILIETLYENYQGWMDPKQYAPISEADAQDWLQQKAIVDLSLTATVQKPNGETIQLVPGCTLPFFKDNQLRLGETTYRFSGAARIPQSDYFAQEVVIAARFFLNAPYLWGGRTPWGIDCSGLTQQVYKHFGMPILRDASQQATQGETVDFLAEAKPGDLAFFDNAEGRIIHVGILLSPEEIIHASGRVKIESIDNQGIYSEELGKRTHQLRIIKRFYQTPAYQ
ncbi:MAG: NlpC/P60 family protein [Sphingobacteriaceae bacterium]